MASCVLSGRTSLAGSVCLLWMPGETEGGCCISLMKGCAPATDIIRLVHSLTPPKIKRLVPSLCSRSAGPPLFGPCEDNRRVCVRIYSTTRPAVIHRWFAFEYLMSMNGWRSQLRMAITVNPTINCVDWCLLVFVSTTHWQISDLEWTATSGLYLQQVCDSSGSKCR